MMVGLLMLGAQLVAAFVAATGSDPCTENTFYYDNWCGGLGEESLRLLDDAECNKVFPSDSDRSWQCARTVTKPSPGFEPESVPLSRAAVDTVSLEAAGVPKNVQLCLLLVERDLDGEVYTKRMCSGNGERISFEPWSSSKAFAIGNAAGRLREQCTNMGLDATQQGGAPEQPSPLGDLGTIVASYDHTQNLTSNSVSSYFHDLGSRKRAHDLIARDWLRLNVNVSGEDALKLASLGGNYGETSPPTLGFRLVGPGGHSTCEIDPDAPPITYPNSMTALALAEGFRRIVLHRETSNPLPSAQWADVETMLYGTRDSVMFPEGVEFGGMAADPAIYLQAALDEAYHHLGGIRSIDDAVAGQWRIYSKLGAGYSSSRGKGEIVTLGYGCIPGFRDEAGVEFTLAARGSVTGDVTLKKAEAAVHRAVNKAVLAMVADFSGVATPENDGAQDEDSWEGVRSVLRQGAKRHVFPGYAALAATNDEPELFVDGFGSLSYEGADLSVHPSTTIWDLASLTKVLATTTAVAQFYERGELGLDDLVSSDRLLGKRFANEGKEAITVRNLLLHNSGLPPGPVPSYSDQKFGCPATLEGIPVEMDSRCTSLVVDSLMSQPLRQGAVVGGETVYSDLSMITLALVVGGLASELRYVENANLRPTCSGASDVRFCAFEAYVRRHVLLSAGMASRESNASANLWFSPPPFAAVNTAPTWREEGYRNATIRGVVSDENAFAMGGISGHAGLFGTVYAVATITRAWLFAGEEGGSLINASTAHTFVTVADASKSTRALGWDTHTDLSTACGSFGPKTFTHTGYTGTQICADPERGLFTVLLTNRCHPDKTGQMTEIAEVRRHFNDAVREVFDARVV